MVVVVVMIIRIIVRAVVSSVVPAKIKTHRGKKFCHILPGLSTGIVSIDLGVRRKKSNIFETKRFPEYVFGGKKSKKGEGARIFFPSISIYFSKNVFVLIFRTSF